jgi:hypothetical protein
MMGSSNYQQIRRQLNVPKMMIRSPLILGCFLWTSSAWNGYLSTTSTSRMKPHCHCLFSSLPTSSSPSNDETLPETPLYIEEGLFAVAKPLEWTSQQVVGRLRGLLEKDAKARGAPDNRSKRRKPWMKVGHGGTLDPLATGVLVVGVGKGTKNLQKYLTGTKGYRAGVELGFQTTTLDLDPTGAVVGRKPFDHVTWQAIEDVLEQFRGTIQQKPPIFRYA